jgi:hypothetical protein
MSGLRKHGINEVDFILQGDLSVGMPIRAFPGAVAGSCVRGLTFDIEKGHPGLAGCRLLDGKSGGIVGSTAPAPQQRNNHDRDNREIERQGTDTQPGSMTP